MAGGTNLYAYAGNNPVSFSDPFGLNPCLAGPVAFRLCAAAATAVGTALGAAAHQVYQNYRQDRPLMEGTGRAALRGARDGAAGALGGEVAGKLLAGARAAFRVQVGTRYMGAAEAEAVSQTGTIPSTNAAGRPRVVHYTTDAPTMSAAEAQAKYMLPEKPTHMCQFPMCNVQNSVAPTGPVAPGASQAATSMPINGAGRPVPLDP